MRRWALAAVVVALVLGAWLVVRPFMARQREYPAEIPSPAALLKVASVPLDPGRPACFRYAVAEPHSQQARLKLGVPPGRSSGPIVLSLRATDGSSYAQRVTIPAGLGGTPVVGASVAPPPVDTPLRVCLANHGSVPVSLFASGGRTLSRSHAIVAGHDTDRSIWFSFYEAAPQSITQRLPATIARMTVLRPGYATRGLLWVLFVLMLVGVPVAVGWAVVRGAADDEAASAPPDVDRRRPAWRRLLD